MDIRIDASVSLEQGLGLLAEGRKKATIIKNAMQKTQAALDELIQQTPLYIELEKAKDGLSTLTEDINTIDAHVRHKALEAYTFDDTRDKSVADGVSIAEYTTFDIDQNLAIAWASEHHQKALKLNTTEIKKVAKAGMEVHGVVLGKENRVKIATDLSQYIEGEGQA